MSEKKSDKEFWVTNTSYKRDVSVGDLRVTIRRGQTVNLLSKHYYYTIEQLEESLNNGSLKKRSNVLKVVSRPKQQLVKPGIYEAQKPLFSKQLRLGQKLRSGHKLEVKKFTDLGDNLDMRQEEERFAEEAANFEFEDNAPILPVDKNYKKKDE